MLRVVGGGLKSGTDAFVLTKHADVSLVVKDPVRFPVLGQVRVGVYASQGMSPEDTYATYSNLMQAAMVSLRPTQELYIRHRKELTDPWVGAGALRHRDMITKHANDLLDEWIDEGEVELDRLESIGYGEGNDWLHQPGIMLGTLKLNLRFTKADTPLSLGTGRTSSTF